MRYFFKFSFQKMLIVSILGCTVFLSDTFAGQVEIIPLENKPIGFTTLVSDTNSMDNSGDSHKKGEGSSGKKLLHSDYSHKKTEGSASKSYSNSHRRYSHGQTHGKSSRRYGGHSSYGHGSGHSMNNPFHHVLKLKESIGLTKNQITQIKDQKFEYEKQNIKFYAEKKIAKMELERVLHSENLDETHARNLASQIAQLKGQMVKIRVEAKITIMNLLTVEQRKKVSQMYNSHN